MRADVGEDSFEDLLRELLGEVAAAPSSAWEWFRGGKGLGAAVGAAVSEA